MRITPLQKEIFDIQLEAAKKNFEGCLVFSLKGMDKELAKAYIKTNLLAKQPISGLWKALFEEHVSVTSQLMASSECFSYISGAAIKIMRAEYKKIFNSLNIK